MTTWKSDLILVRRAERTFITLAALACAACATPSDPTPLSVLVDGDPAIVGRLSSVVVQTFNGDGSKLLERYAFALAEGGAAPRAQSLPLTHAFRAPREKDGQLRVVALGLGLVEGVERTLVEAQKTTSVVSGSARELTLYFSEACYQKFCRTALLGSTQTCVAGSCVSIPSADEPAPEPHTDASDHELPPRLDAGAQHDVAVDARTSTVVEGIDSGALVSASEDAGCTVGGKFGCRCADGTSPPCSSAPPDAGPICDLGKHVGTFTGSVGQNASAPNTEVAGEFAFEVPAPGANNVVSIVSGSIQGTTPAGHTLVARVEGSWNCARRSFEAGRLVGGVFTYVDRFLNNKVDFTGTVTGGYAAGAPSATGEWKTISESNTGGFGTWSARR